MSDPQPTLLVMAKAPVAGEAKTRLGADVGMQVAADLAAAALLDTLDVVRATFPHAGVVLALAGDLDRAERGLEIRSALDGWVVVPQRGEGFGERLANAHATIRGPVLQIGMDTPHLAPELLREAAGELASSEAVLGLAEDGGWWLLGLRDPARASVLGGVAMSTDETGADTLAALSDLAVTRITTTYDVDTVAEAARAADDAPRTRFARAWRARPVARERV